MIHTHVHNIIRVTYNTLGAFIEEDYEVCSNFRRIGS